MGLWASSTYVDDATFANALSVANGGYDITAMGASRWIAFPGRGMELDR